MTQKTALITGVSGQDGSLLTKHLLSLGYKIIAVTRNKPDLWRLILLGILKDPNISYMCYQEWIDFKNILKQNKIDEFYHLAAMSHVGQSHNSPLSVFDVNSIWTIELLNCIVRYSSHTRFFFASSCEIFDINLNKSASEDDKKKPTNPYGISKNAAHLMVEYFREVKGLFSCNAILFNHESSLRDDSFVSKKIVSSVAKIVKGHQQTLSLGNIYSQKDWSCAVNLVPYFHKILNLEQPDDFVLASGQLHSVKDMVDCAFTALDYPISWHGSGLDCVARNKKGQTVVSINPKHFRPLDNRFLTGNTAKAQKYLDFNKLTPFASWVKDMVVFEWNKLT